MDGCGNAVLTEPVDQPLVHTVSLVDKDAKNFVKLITTELSDKVEISQKKESFSGKTRITLIIRGEGAIRLFKKSILSGPLNAWKVVIQYPPQKPK